MVETLVAVIVLAVGLLGVASLFAISLHSSSDAIERMQAVNLASDIADRIRANRTAGNAYQGTGARHNCVGAAPAQCTTQQMAEDDVARWQDAITSVFQGTGSGSVNFTAGTPAIYQITVSWTEKKTTQSYVTWIQVPTT